MPTTGQCVILHTMDTGSGSVSLGTITNIETIGGTDSDMTTLNAGGFAVGNPQVETHNIWIGRVISNGDISADVIAPGTEPTYARLYTFEDMATGTTLDAVRENGGSGVLTGAGTSTSVLDALVTTNSSNRLALQFIAVVADQALTNMAGETGGDWTELIAEFSSAGSPAGTLGLQGAPMASAGTINGGSLTISSAAWGTVGFALIPDASTIPSFMEASDGVSISGGTTGTVEILDTAVVNKPKHLMLMNVG